ncbi:hypothetical protein GCM10009846_04090 [Agrococcus versicolor]|uniref:Uncharacterized protein n=1 Tax=Agrococcus versicolor TaxID=501482 RepID=A0ABP5MAC7_9MICO
MELGSYASHLLPPQIARAFRVTTAGDLADELGAQGEVTPALAREAEAAYDAYLRGDVIIARTFLVARLGLSERAAHDALRRLAQA